MSNDYEGGADWRRFWGIVIACALVGYIVEISGVFGKWSPEGGGAALGAAVGVALQTGNLFATEPPKN